MDLEQLVEGPFDRLLNVLLALLVDNLGGGMASPFAVLQELVAAPEATPAHTLATWGTDPEALAAQEAMMRLLG